jgi:hypothetical protein
VKNGDFSERSKPNMVNGKLLMVNGWREDSKFEDLKDLRI